MTLLLFAWTAYVSMGVLVMLAVRVWGIWEPLHVHFDHDDDCDPGPDDQCRAHWVGRKPLPLAGWFFGVVLWPIVVAVWVVILAACALVRVGSIPI